MKSYILYGMSEVTLEDSLPKVESALNIKLAAHDSLYRGGLYYRFDHIGEENFVLQRNLELDNELAENEFPEHRVLLRVNATKRPEDIHNLLISKIPDIVLLRREDRDK